MGSSSTTHKVEGTTSMGSSSTTGMGSSNMKVEMASTTTGMGSSNMKVETAITTNMGSPSGSIEYPEDKVEQLVVDADHREIQQAVRHFLDMPATWDPHTSMASNGP